MGQFQSLPYSWIICFHHVRRDITCMEVSFGGRQQRVRRPPNNVYDDRQQH